MKLMKMAISNIKHNIKNYFMYFFAMCFSVFTTYSFLSLAVSKSVGEKVGTNQGFAALFISFAVIILVFVLFFLISSNNSFIRARKKEISTYALFGMQNSRIGRLLFFETLALGIVAIVVGIGFGIGFSKLTTMILLKMTLAEFTGDISFDIEPNAIYITAIIFIGIFCVMGLSGNRIINKFKLVDLFKGAKISEGRSKGSYLVLVLSLALIIGGYYLAVTLGAMQVVTFMVLILIMVIVGTYLFFWGGVQKLIHILKLNKRSYYKDANLVSTSLLSHRTKTMASTMATIAILVAVGTTAISFGYTLFTKAGDTVNNQNHFDLYFYTDDIKMVEKVHDVFDKYDNKITSEIQFERYVTQPDTVNFPTNYGQFIANKDVFRIYSESQYNKIVDASNHDGEHMNIEKGNVTLIYNSYRNKVSWDNAKLKFKDRELVVTAMPGYEYSFGYLLMTVIDDEDFDALINSGEITTKLNGKEYWPLTGINYTDNLKSKDIAIELNKVLSGKVGQLCVTYENYTAMLSIFGLICFIGFFMCAIFILMTASMLYFKQVTIATEEKPQYKTLKKIGVDNDMKNKIIRKRLLPIFLIPLLIGILHSVFAMKAADTLIFSMMIPIENSFLSVLKTSGLMYLVYGAVYAIFYFVTKAQYKRIIK